jgi:hypothetical protein
LNGSGEEMEQHAIQEILQALKLYSTEMNTRFDSLEKRMDSFENRMDQLETRVEGLETKMDERFDRLEKKLDGIRVELIETQETVDYLASKNLQHERKLRAIVIKED